MDNRMSTRITEAPDAKVCGLCREDFDEGLRCPRIFKCFHTICTNCIEQLIRQGNRKCPFCNKDFKAKRTDDVPANRMTLDFLNYVGQLGSDYKSSGKERLDTSRRNITTRETHLSMERLRQQARIFSGHQNIMGRSPGTSFDEDDQEYFNHFNGGSLSSDDSYGVEETCDAKVCRVCCEDFDERGERCPRIFKCFHTVCSSCVDQMIRNDDKKCPFCRKGFRASRIDDVPVNQTAIDIIKHITTIQMESSSRVSFIRSDSSGLHEAEGDEDGYHIQSLSEMTIREKNSPERITVENLLEMSDSMEKLLEDGMVFAIQQKEKRGRRRSRIARITNDDDKLCLHHLSDERLMSQHRGVCLIEYADVLELVDLRSRLVFLELGVCGSTLGRLYIRLSSDTKGAQQFSLLCTGERGPSYANSNILQVWGKDHEGERVLCGDYETNSGSGGESLVPGLREEESEEYSKPRLAGTVVGSWKLGDEIGAQFFINTRDSPRKESYPVLGMVEEGLNVLRDAISEYPNIRYVSIQECGLVLPH